MSFRYPLCALALLALLAPPLASTASTLPVADFIRHPAFGNVVISPDGKYLAVVSAVKDSEKYQLAILPTRSVLEKKPQVTAHYNLREYELFDDVFWVNDERIAASTAVQYGGFDRPFGTGELYAVNADGSLQKVLAAGNQSRVGNFSPIMTATCALPGVRTIKPAGPNFITALPAAWTGGTKPTSSQVNALLLHRWI
jgi:hypothetical protein